MNNIILICIVSLCVSAQGAEIQIITPRGSAPNVLMEDVSLAVKLLDKCTYLQKTYPIEYKRLHQTYLVVEMQAPRRLMDMDLCGLAVPEGNTIYIYPSAWTKAGCYDKRLTGTIVHEILHLMGLPDHSSTMPNVDNDAIERTVYECWEKFTVEPTSVEKSFNEDKNLKYRELP